MNVNGGSALGTQKTDHCTQLALGGRSEEELHFEQLPSQDCEHRSRLDLWGFEGGSQATLQFYQISRKVFLMAPVPWRPYFTDMPRTTESVLISTIFLTFAI